MDFCVCTSVSSTFAISLLYGRTVLKCSFAPFHWSSDLGNFIPGSLETLSYSKYEHELVFVSSVSSGSDSGSGPRSNIS